MMKLLRVFSLLSLCVLAACGTVATPVWEAAQNGGTPEAEGEGAAVAQVATLAPTATLIPPTNTPTSIPTATLVPPTATPAPPTNTPVPPTAVPPTVAPTEGAIAAAPVAFDGDPVNGENLFVNGKPQVGGIACTTCHLNNSETSLVGPGLLGIAGRAANRVPGQDAATYLHTAVVAPNDYVVEGYPAGVMPQIYGDVYTEQEINDLVAYMLTLE